MRCTRGGRSLPRIHLLAGGLACPPTFEVPHVAFEASQRTRFLPTPPAEDTGPASGPSPQVIAIPIDAYADAALRRERDAAGRTDVRCDACDETIDGEPAGLGVFLSTRGDEVRFEEPALCLACATAIGVRAQMDSEIEEEEG